MSFELLRGLTYLLLAAVAVPAATQWVGDRHRLRQFIAGLLMAAGGCASMLDPIVVQPGLQLDFRNLAVVLSGPLFGWISSLVVALVVAAFRVHLGGIGMVPGLIGIALSCAVGIVMAVRLQKTGRVVSWLGLFLPGLVGAFVPVALALAFAPFREAAAMIFAFSGPEVVIANILAALLIGYVVKNDQQRVDALRHLQTCTDNMPGVLYQKIMRPDGSVHHKLANSGIEKLLDVTREEVERDPTSWLRWLFPEDREVLDQANARYAATKSLDPWQFEGRHRRDDGSVIWLRTDAKARRLPDGSICWDGLMTDVTAERTLEQRRREVENTRKAALEELATQLEVTVGKALYDVGESVRDMHAAATGMAGSADKTTQRAVEVTREAESASRRVGSVAVAAEEIEASIRELTSQTAHADQTARNAASYIRSTRQDVAGLAEAADKVSAVLGFIEEIAARTNLLALNATIEAARAGAAGRGFAVVAGEVKNLAEQTQQATRDIAATLQGIRGAAATASEAVQHIETTMTTMERTSGILAEVVSRQADIASGIAADAQAVAGSTSAVTASVGSVGDEARVTGGAAQRVVEAARKVDDETAALDRYVGEFVRSVRQRL